MSDEHDPIEKLRRLHAALADEDDDDLDLVEGEAKALSPSEKALADSIRRRVDDALAKEALAKHEALRAAFSSSRRALAEFPEEPVRPRDEALAILKELIARAGEGAASIHFHKYDDATPEDLARIIRELRFLLAEASREPKK